MTAAASHFDRRDVIQAVAGLMREGPAADLERIAEEFLASEKVISLGHHPKGERFTTQRIWTLEQQALDAAGRMRGADHKTAGEMVAARTLHAHPDPEARPARDGPLLARSRRGWFSFVYGIGRSRRRQQRS